MGDFMLDSKMETLLAVVELGNFTKAAQALNMTQPAVSHHIKQLEEELGVSLFIRNKSGLKLTAQGEIAVKYAKRLTALHDKMKWELKNCGKNLSILRVGITHTSESNQTAATLAKYSDSHIGMRVILFTDTVPNLYSMLENQEIDLAIIDGASTDSRFASLLLDRDNLICAMAVDNPMADKKAISISELKQQRLILRTPSSATRTLFEASLESIGESVWDFNIMLEVDNIATIKDLIRKDLGVSILPRSVCVDELRKGKLAALPIENLTMLRETRIVFAPDFSHPEIPKEILMIYTDSH